MAVYQAPLRDMRFVLYELFDAESLWADAGDGGLTPDLADAVLGEAAKLCEDVLFPLNRSGDEEGCVLENGAVRTPAGFKEAYRAFAEGGWTGLGCDPAHGGQGLPQLLNMMVLEMVCAANLSFGMYPGLSRGAYDAVYLHGADDLKSRYLPKLADGTWSGTMCLTEPQCGTDLGLVRTRAAPTGDGGFAITGDKIFISAGEHDLTENILHLVLARIDGAPGGTSGLSLFLVPKFLPDAAGRPGARNGVTCTALEHKMGIAASATCALRFEDATGFLVGRENGGMRAMFTMMNAARLGVGMQGLGIMEAAYQGAVAYAREREQGRALSGPKAPDRPADPILHHPDLRRMLLTGRAYAEGARALAAWIAAELDAAQRASDPQRRAAAADFVALMTPIAKALFTDLGSEVANLGVQVYGGHGYIREHGMEQYVRDARITQIYEGTNGIQALDLVGRKLPVGAGRLLRGFFHPVNAFIEAHGADPALAPFVKPLAKSFQALQGATAFLAQKGLANPDEAAAAASEYLRLFGLVALAFMWARMARAAAPKAAEGGADGAFYRAKLGTARFYMARLLPQAGALYAAITGGGGSILDFALEDF